MRFALRNRDKLIKSFGSEYYNSIVFSLKRYFESNEVHKYNIEGKKYQFIDIPNICSQTDSFFQFAIIRQRYDVLILAYYNTRK